MSKASQKLKMSRDDKLISGRAYARRGKRTRIGIFRFKISDDHSSSGKNISSAKISQKLGNATRIK